MFTLVFAEASLNKSFKDVLMSVINLATERPASINTVEETAAWALLLLHDLNKGSTYKEAVGTSIDSGLAPLVDISIVSTADGNARLICRASFELAPDYVTDKTQKLWLKVQELSTAVVPAAFKVD